MVMFCEACHKLVGEIDTGLNKECPMCGASGRVVQVPQLVVYRGGLTDRPLQFDFHDGNEYPVTDEYEKAFALVDSQGRDVFIPKWTINNYFVRKEA